MTVKHKWRQDIKLNESRMTLQAEHFMHKSEKLSRLSTDYIVNNFTIRKSRHKCFKYKTLYIHGRHEKDI